MKTKKVTIDELAIMVQHGFTEMDKRFDNMDKRFDRLEKRFDKLEDIVLSDHRPRIRTLEKELDI